MHRASDGRGAAWFSNSHRFRHTEASEQERVVTFKTTDLYDEFSAEVSVCLPIFRSFGGRMQFSGPASTIKCFEDNSRVREAVNQPGEARVLVVDGGGSLRCALLGDLLAAAAVKNGWAGIIINGCARDTTDLAGMPIGILALAANPTRSEKRNEGQRDLPVELAGVHINPGDFIYVDADGVLVARRALAVKPS
jgi:regulator of ribonuclease activity A